MDIEQARHAFVTGGASGIGLAIAQALAARGVGVTIADVNRAAIDAVLADNPGLNGVQLDVSDRAAWLVAKAEAQGRLGPVDILINNAGIASIGYATLELDPATFDRIIAVNLTGVYNGLLAFAPDMQARGSGHIVNTSSMAGICSPTQHVGGAYAAAKFGVMGMSETLRVELEPHGVGVSILMPGMVATGILENSVKFGGASRFTPPPGHQHGGGSPAEVGALVVDAIIANTAYIPTHGVPWWPKLEARHRALEASFEGMRGEG
jgi:NAD(P)-dependent dehydrogenase (short-subunit alcohol dehydrogenase family)